MTLPYALLVAPLALGATPERIAASLTPASTAGPALRLDDLGVTRGDAIFETLGVLDGRPRDVGAHLARFVQSARLCDLPEPDPVQWRAAIERACAESPAGESSVRIVLSRGTSAGATGWVVASPGVDHAAERADGVRVVTLDRGYDSGAAQRAPWLLLGAKTQSYAVNMAALREARRRGADDVVFHSSDGVLLEGPTSTVVLRVGDRFVTPRTSVGILRGTTQLALFAHLEARGFETAEETLPVAAVAEADAAWLLSSVRLAVPVRAVDGVERPVDAALTADLNSGLLHSGLA
jgi:4-amino-4-deoxychorismate lyase